ncbi:M28 family peptidase [Shewanella sp.]|uniref:M28 family peptidase n=1 Tax=Shewanella sp. TaxID=50422 RepID=UPI00405457B5
MKGLFTTKGITPSRGTTRHDNCLAPQFLAPLLLLLLMLNGCVSTPSCNQPLHTRWVDKAQLTQDLQVLTSSEFQGRKTRTRGAKLTQDYLASRFEALKLTPWQGSYYAPFKYGFLFSTREGVNMIGVFPAQKPSSRWRIITAHYDHLGKQGSHYYPGVAALLSIAAQWQREPMEEVNLMLVATDAEEPGLYGAYSLVGQLKTMPEMQIELALNLDMIGHPSRPHAIYMEGEKNLANFDTLAPTLTQHSKLCLRVNRARVRGASSLNIDWLRASDHYAFHKADIPWLYLGVPPHKNYHTVNDTLETINLDFLGATTELAFELINLSSEQLKPLKPKIKE